MHNMINQTIVAQQEIELFAALGLASLRSEPSPSVAESPSSSKKQEQQEQQEQEGDTSTTSRLTKQEEASSNNDIKNKFKKTSTYKHNASETTPSKNLEHDVNPNTNNNYDKIDVVVYSKLSFPQKLYKILHDDKYQDIIRFAPESDAFIQFVDKKRLCEEVLPLVFNETKFQTFIRSLIRWHFYKVTTGQFAGSYYHEYFRKNKPNLCSMISIDSYSKRKFTRVRPTIDLIREREGNKNYNRNSSRWWLKENNNKTIKVSDVENVPNQQESMLVTRSTAVPEQEVERKSPSVVAQQAQEEGIVPSNTTPSLHQTIQDPSTMMTMMSSVPAAAATTTTTLTDFSIIQSLMRHRIEEQMLLELQHLQLIEINKLNLRMKKYIAEAQTLNNMASCLPAVFVHNTTSTNNERSQLLLNSPSLHDFLISSSIQNMNGGTSSTRSNPAMNTTHQNIF